MRGGIVLCIVFVLVAVVAVAEERLFFDVEPMPHVQLESFGIVYFFDVEPMPHVQLESFGIVYFFDDLGGEVFSYDIKANKLRVRGDVLIEKVESLPEGKEDGQRSEAVCG